LNTIPAADNGWNYYGGAYSQPWNVGTGTAEQNGTYDMMGNVNEWNEILIDSSRGVRGGSYYGSYGGLNLASSYRISGSTFVRYDLIGFRVAEIPEPATPLLLSLGGLALWRRHRRTADGGVQTD
jgi:formylglycine-generating enzyme required for sulfatase activity